ncbi:MAG: undecaprenyldiphospho-muramoylpentapeptide beta-N-acetylglucosaminyltransferase [Proteobacteria bacterium]|nr:undecaprenyldiphospho-muramoylpentapeptide beta-N-acetylglucosaminyltransferase [Pseudomonadota bacterium]
MSRHLVIAAAGTGGHVMPGLAVARVMQARGWSVSWLGTEGGLENTLVPPSGIEMDRLAFAGMRGKGLGHALKGAAQMGRAVGASRRVLKTRRASALLGMGGYVCVPAGLGAWLGGVPLVLMNADAAWLMSNKLLAPLAARVAFGFDGEAAREARRGVVTGNPVRAEIEAMAAPAARFAGREGPLSVLVVGGSLGAQVLNETVPAALSQMAPEARPRITHQTGAAHIESVRARYATLGLTGEGVEVLPFIDDMAARLAACDLVVCRAGAITVSELGVAGVASVLVPLVVGTTAHQRDNAQWMAERHAALHLPQAEFSPAALAGLLATLTRERLLGMAEQARLLGRRNAAGQVADEIERMAA